MILIHGLIHICNSYAFLKYPEMRLNCARIGSAFTGRIIINSYNFKRVGKLVARISEIKTLPKGYTLGYGNSYKLKKDTKVATIPVGYIDGYNMESRVQIYSFMDKIRTAAKAILKNSNKEIVINNKTCKVLGQIGMYHTSIDVQDLDLNIGDEIEIDLKPFYVDTRIRREYK